jgi:hypothetical protein
MSRNLLISLAMVFLVEASHPLAAQPNGLPLGPFTGTVNRMTANDSGQLILGGTGMHRSTNSGNSWSPLSIDLFMPIWPCMGDASVLSITRSACGTLLAGAEAAPGMYSVALETPGKRLSNILAVTREDFDLEFSRGDAIGGCSPFL